jgi:tetratricopeptide (TPR) repeat protein
MILIYEKLGDEQGIIRELTDKLALYPDDPNTLWELAYYLQRTGQKEEARTYLEKLLVQYPDQPRLYREAGLLDLELGLREKAAKLLRRYLELYPQAPDSTSIRELIPGSNSP